MRSCIRREDGLTSNVGEIRRQVINICDGTWENGRIIITINIAYWGEFQVHSRCIHPVWKQGGLGYHYHRWLHLPGRNRCKTTRVSLWILVECSRVYLRATVGWSDVKGYLFASDKILSCQIFVSISVRKIQLSEIFHTTGQWLGDGEIKLSHAYSDRSSTIPCRDLSSLTRWWEVQLTVAVYWGIFPNLEPCLTGTCLRGVGCRWGLAHIYG